MYEEYFGLTRNPFSIVPDPRYFFVSEGHREALAHLTYGIGSDGGFVLLTGEVGTGKTTVCRRLLEMVPEDTEVAFILNPRLTVEELLATVCDEFGIRYPDGNRSVKVFVDAIYEYLLRVHEQGRRAVLIIEEAQNLHPGVLEQIRLLTNLETKERKLLQIIMLGQPELRDMLSRPELLQLSQRITARYHLGALSGEELPGYIKHRLSVAGLVRGQLFPPSVMGTLFRLTKGVPRVINAVCDRALLGAYVQGKEQVDRKTLKAAAREVSGRGALRMPRGAYRWVPAGLGLILLLLFGTIYYFYGTTDTSSASSGSTGQVRAVKAAPAALRGGTLSRPANLAPDGGRAVAYEALFRKWKAEYRASEGRDICDQARDQSLRCMKGRGSLIALSQMNRPAVLRFLDEQGGEYFGLMSSLKGGNAVFSVGKEVKTVDAREIARWWSGEYLLLWRAPPEYRDELRPGGRGSMVAWVAGELARIEGKAPPGEHDRVYRGEMVKKVKRLQISAGLMPDGVVGPRTIMALTAAAGRGEPLLQDGKGEE